MTKIIAVLDQRKKNLTDRLKARAAFDRETAERARAQKNEEQRRAAADAQTDDDDDGVGGEDIGDDGGGDVGPIEGVESAMELEPMELDPVEKDNDPDDDDELPVEEANASAPESNKKK